MLLPSRELILWQRLAPIYTVENDASGRRYTSVEGWLCGRIGCRNNFTEFQILFSSPQIDCSRTVVSLSRIVTFNNNNCVFDNRIRSSEQRLRFIVISLSNNASTYTNCILGPIGFLEIIVSEIIFRNRFSVNNFHCYRFILSPCDNRS